MNKETKVINKGIKIIRFSVFIKIGGGGGNEKTRFRTCIREVRGK